MKREYFMKLSKVSDYYLKDNQQIAPMRKIILFLFASILLYSCGTKIEEIVEERFPDGKPKLVRFYEVSDEGRELLKEIAYYRNGYVRVEGELKNGVKHGKWVYWYENGHKWSEGNFVEGRRDGVHRTYHDNGSRYTEGRWELGVRRGIWQYWTPEGALEKEINYDE
jgi:antitoxin component YwqK of YwqJK toxin-antitoxin module